MHFAQTVATVANQGQRVKMCSVYYKTFIIVLMNADDYFI